MTLDPATPIIDVDLTTRAFNVLVAEGWATVGDVIAGTGPFPLAALRRLPNCGKVTAGEILERVVAPFYQKPVVVHSPTEQEDEQRFVDWCLRNRTILELLRALQP